MLSAIIFAMMKLANVSSNAKTMPDVYQLAIEMKLLVGKVSIRDKNTETTIHLLVILYFLTFSSGINTPRP